MLLSLDFRLWRRSGHKMAVDMLMELDNETMLIDKHMVSGHNDGGSSLKSWHGVPE